MCGILGIYSLGNSPSRADVRRMAQLIRHRGPDSEGYWQDPEAGIVLAHRRLAIVDLSPAGHQPMHSAGSRFVLTYNGEIYNHEELRQELNGLGTRAWQGHSDTEVLLAGFEAWGVRGTIERVIGMFAFAVWDRAERMLTLGRDRVGEKPLYYGEIGRDFVFTSELKPLREHPDFRGEVDRDVLALYLRHNYVPAPYCIYRGLKKLEPGCLLTVSADRRSPRIERYWDAAATLVDGRLDPSRLPFADASLELERLLRHAIGQQMMADVPLGAFLSGGVDSSTIVALMQAQSSRPVKTFTIGFDEKGFNEAEHAKSVARHLGTEHTELYVRPAEAREVIPLLPGIYDEPFADSSQIPTYLVAKLARQNVTVALSGDAGDELFGGYNRYLFTENLWSRLSRVPRPLRTGIARSVQAVPVNWWAAGLRPFAGLLKMNEPADKLLKAATVLASPSLPELYRHLVSQWRNPEQVVPGSREPATPLTADQSRFAGLSPAELMMALDLITYLPDDILVKVDRAAMAVSLETRVPLLDHRVVEFAGKLPLHYKVSGGETKRILRDVLFRHVPRSLIERPKMGFGVPVGAWLGGPLRDWAEQLLAPERISREGYFDTGCVQQAWREHLSGRRDWTAQLWTVLMFQSWLQDQGDVTKSRE